MSKTLNNFFYTLLGYIVILIILMVCALGIGVIVFWLLRNGFKPSDDDFNKWGGFSLFTLGLFGYMIKRYRAFWRRAVFWRAFAALAPSPLWGFRAGLREHTPLAPNMVLRWSYDRSRSDLSIPGLDPAPS